MNTSSSILLVCILVTCAVWTVQGRNVKVSADDEEQVEISEEAGGIPGACWACKWALKKVKKALTANATAERIKSKLMSVCDQIGLLKSLCSKFVKKNLWVLIEELTTTDDVRTICVNIKACRPKELLDVFYERADDSNMEMDE